MRQVTFVGACGNKPFVCADGGLVATSPYENATTLFVAPQCLMRSFRSNHAFWSPLDEIVWFEPGIEPSEPLDGDNHNATIPIVGETRHVCMRHGHQEPIGGKMWLLFQSGYSLANGFPEPESELEKAALIEVEILSQTKLPKRKSYYDRVEYNAQVRCLQVLTLSEITENLATCSPLYWPEINRQIQLFETPSFRFVWLMAQESTEWFVLTRTTPPKMILARYTIPSEDRFFSVCNCEWDWAKWPHRVHKARR